MYEALLANVIDAVADLAGEVFRPEAERLEERLFGQKSGQK